MEESRVIKSGLSHRKAVLLLVLAATLWSSGGVLIKLVDLSGIAVAGWRSAIAAVTILLYLGRPRFNGLRAQFWTALCYAATVLMFVVATKLTTAANAVLLQYTAPLWTAILGARFFGERVTKLDVIIICVVCGGMVLFFADRLAPGSLFGNVLAILSGITLALFTLGLRLQRETSTLDSILYGNIAAVALSLPFLFDPVPTFRDWLMLLPLGILQLGLSYILLSVAIRYVSALETMLICTVEPILNPVWVAFGVGELPGPWAIAGGIIVVTGITARALIANRIAKAEVQTRQVPS